MDTIEVTSAPINRSLTQSVRPRKRTVGRWIALIVVPGIVWGGVSYWRYSSQFEQTDDAYVTGHQHPVSFRVSGTISEVLVDDNQLVKQGQAVAELDPKDYEIALAQARADWEKARAQLSQSHA